MWTHDAIFGFEKLPTGRGVPMASQFEWIAAKRIDDDIGNNLLWRIHEKIYDFRGFNHPGGWDFLEISRGTDITELFESSHPNIAKASSFLEKYYVAEAKTVRNTRTFTFHKNDFYDTLRSRVLPILDRYGRSATWQMTCLHDGLLLAYLLSVLMLCAAPSVIQTRVLHHDISWVGAFVVLPAISGLLLALLLICSHNFFHQRNNWRMYSFDLGPNSSYEWRISHVYSHHVYPNTINDYEVSGIESLLPFLPIASRPSHGALIVKLGFVYTIVFGMIFHISVILWP
jgi:hypothetical protein